ncbi:hypothetical protein FisN_11Hh033 [Fistulifera solaris]|uniref:Uncharacterized protein n=1 Tax=Fistulifera solaris TaxID=1519565 RepID=A0A1Z5JKG6_FISSO|nr:hypothetical protein FisN_11Hh033 [Fistulifera solaris]|eukprot:GAX14505.1 hypothetical protein FisN_11Hh033 [Fistulifera solaris]
MAERNSSAPQSAPKEDEGVSALQFAIMAVVLGSSAGMTLYTKRTGSMLQTMNQITQNQLAKNPPKFGPLTKKEWEKLRPRFEKDDFF